LNLEVPHSISVIVEGNNAHKIRDKCNYYYWFLMHSAISMLVTRAWCDPQVGVARDGLQIRRAVANMLNKESRKTDKG
jgi:hypothetical protein